MKPHFLITGFLPWIVFSLISTRMAGNGVAWSALIAVAITIAAMAISRPAWPPKILNVGSVVLFGVIAIIGFVGGPAVDEWLYTWAAPGVAPVRATGKVTKSFQHGWSGRASQRSDRTSEATAASSR